MNQHYLSHLVFNKNRLMHKYYPEDKKKKNKSIKPFRVLPEIPHALTEEEWENSENLKILRRNTKNRGIK